MRIPNHIAIIPDGNRRWAINQGLAKEEGYTHGLSPGLSIFHTCQALGVKELTYYGFTTDNTKRPTIQRIAFTKACVEAVKLLSKEDATLLVVGNTTSKMFPKELLPYTTRQVFGKGTTKVNFLLNYSWEWDLGLQPNNNSLPYLTQDISRVDLVLRWGGRQRLSGLLPIQTVYADFYFFDHYWPQYSDTDISKAFTWYQSQDTTLGG